MYIFLMIKRVLWRFNHNYVEPMFSSVISH